MKLNELNTEILYKSDDNVVLYYEQINESSIKIGLSSLTAGGIIKKSLQGFGKFAKKHPFITGAMASYGASALKKYKKNKRNTIKFYTKDIQEKKLYKDMIDQLMKSGKYRKEKETFVDGGYLYVLKRLG